MPSPTNSDTSSNVEMMAGCFTEEAMSLTPDETSRPEVSEASLRGISDMINDVDKHQGRANGAGNDHGRFGRYHHGKYY